MPKERNKIKTDSASSRDNPALVAMQSNAEQRVQQADLHAEYAL